METYIVKEGDTLESIANNYNIPARLIIEANNLLPPYLLQINQTLNIPINIPDIFYYYVVKKGDTLYQIAMSNNINVNNLAQINGLNVNDFIYPGQTILVPKQGILTYITSAGDTLYSVSKNFNTTPQELIYTNSNIYLLPEQLIIYTRNN